MTNVESIKQQIAEVESKLAELNSQVQNITSGGDYVFTKDEMLIFMRKFIEQTEKYVKEQVDELDFDSDIVDLDLCGREIEINIDSSEVSRTINYSIDFGNTDDDDMIVSIDHLYNKTKNSQA